MYMYITFPVPLQHQLSQPCTNLVNQLMKEKQTDYRFNLDLIDGCEEEKVDYIFIWCLYSMGTVVTRHSKTAL